MRPYTGDGDERFRTKVRSWAERALGQVDHDHASDQDCRELVRAMGRAGLIAAVAPRRFGGLHPGVRSLPLVVAREELARHSPLADTLFAMQGLGSYPITLAGSPALRKKLLPGVAAGRTLAAFAITEPDSGSDVASMATRAHREGSGYRLEGEKRFISNAGIAGFYTVFARTDPGSGAEGVSAFVVEAGTPGLEVVERTELIAHHPIGRLRFSGCRIPSAQRLGREGQGLRIAFATLDRFRPTVGAAACGLAARALEEALLRVRSRRQFGRPIADFQATRFRLAEMATRLEAARGLVYRAAWLADTGEAVTLAAAMAKLDASESAFQIVDAALQLWGGEGLVRGNRVELLYREVRALRIYEGTSEIQKLVIAREILGDGARSGPAATPRPASPAASRKGRSPRTALPALTRPAR